MSFVFENFPLDERSLITGVILLTPLAYILYRSYSSSSSSSSTVSPNSTPSSTSEEKPKSIMQPARTDLAPPKDDPFTMEELKAYDGTGEGKPIYVAIKGIIFDVTHKSDVYAFFLKRYNVVGRVSDLPDPVKDNVVPNAAFCESIVVSTAQSMYISPGSS
ncbi:hypothetical protein BT96DRAFT_1024439 [Gymnopus androsaceus JB14]|uniref:Cytochrome b5 heme-binding domain-containing protein n=1 Tax=Gymnopus androsaceus JB14 TaxID=1447944 RepID=A0A6A4GZ67_9AGAR|nr:hypothetical protein BT96DRAFT_1024439 [Gymnopus androsaceus JB14]